MDIHTIYVISHLELFPYSLTYPGDLQPPKIDCEWYKVLCTYVVAVVSTEYGVESTEPE